MRKITVPATTTNTITTTQHQLEFRALIAVVVRNQISVRHLLPSVTVPDVMTTDTTKTNDDSIHINRIIIINKDNNKNTFNSKKNITNISKPRTINDNKTNNTFITTNPISITDCIPKNNTNKHDVDDNNLYTKRHSHQHTPINSAGRDIPAIQIASSADVAITSYIDLRACGIVVFSRPTALLLAWDALTVIQRKKAGEFGRNFKVFPKHPIHVSQSTAPSPEVMVVTTRTSSSTGLEPDIDTESTCEVFLSVWNIAKCTGCPSVGLFTLNGTANNHQTVQCKACSANF